MLGLDSYALIRITKMEERYADKNVFRQSINRLELQGVNCMFFIDTLTVSIHELAYKMIKNK